MVYTNSPGFPWVDHSLLEKLLVLSHDLQPNITKISTDDASYYCPAEIHFKGHDIDNRFQAYYSMHTAVPNMTSFDKNGW